MHPRGKELQAIQEKLLDIVWYMRERGFDARMCSAIRLEAGKLEEIASQAHDLPVNGGQGQVSDPEPAAPTETLKPAAVAAASVSGGMQVAVPASVTAFPANRLAPPGALDHQGKR